MNDKNYADLFSYFIILFVLFSTMLKKQDFNFASLKVTFYSICSRLHNIL